MKKITSSLPDDVNNFIITMMFDRIILQNTDFISIGNLVETVNVPIIIDEPLAANAHIRRRSPG